MQTTTQPADPASAPLTPPAPGAAASTDRQLFATLRSSIEAAAFMQCLVTAEAEALDGPIDHEQFAQECMRTGAALAWQMHDKQDATIFHANLKAIRSLLQRIQRDPRLAYYFDQCSQSFEDLTAAHAINYRLDLALFRKEFAGTLTYEAPPVAQGDGA
ncbi:hypothetical protein [Rhodoferax sp. WC2427]|uniref:hypothetical protein n=1 Tax=Rhodoferax sp. WC2427 TaxID=3234144 RepID=UPI003465C318